MEEEMKTREEEALSLLASANNHGDLSVKLSSLSQFTHLLLSSSSSLSSSFASHVFPFLLDLHSSPLPLLRKSLLLVVQEIGLSNLEHSSLLIPVILTLLKDEDPHVANQSIVTGTLFFSALLQSIYRHGKVDRWSEEMWTQMTEFKDAVLGLVSQPVSVGTRLLALKFLETFVLLFTPDDDDESSISKLPTGHPILDTFKLNLEANRLFATLLDLLHSSNIIPAPLTIAVIN